MKLLSVVGTLAMFLVGGGILAHHITPIEHIVHEIAQNASYLGLPAAEMMTAMIANLVTGILAGIAVLLHVTLIQNLRNS
ncbi:MAG: DUF808 family protein, partial [Thalassolituus sp.]